MKCDKCLNESDSVINYAIYYPPSIKKIALCDFCNRIYDTPLLEEFLKDNYGTFPIPKISRDMIEARKKRAKGNSPWQSEDDRLK